MKKVEARTQFRLQQTTMNEADWYRQSERISDAVCQQVNFMDKVIHVFLPIPHKREVNTWIFIDRLWHTPSSQIQLLTSVSDLAMSTMRHYRITPQTQFTTNRYGIPEPTAVTEQFVDILGIDVVLIPLLAFDKQGNRVGYGGGYYDRFLAQVRPDCLKIGLSFFGPVAAIDDVDATDIPLNRCVTPERVYRFN